MKEMIPASEQPARPTGQALAVGGNETAASAVAAQAKALVEARYTVALHRPRDYDTVRERLLKDCKRPSFAAVARYRKPIGAGIEGPSIRFAEAALRAMTNITVETITVYDDDKKRIVRVMVTDLEANLPYSQDVTIEKTVERRSVKKGDEVLGSRLNSNGDTVHTIRATDDDILNKQNALISKAVRTLGLRLVPGDLIDDAMWQVKETQKNADAADPDSAKIRLFDAFGELGIKAAQLKEYLGHAADTLTPKELADLRGLYAAVRDGEATWREVMDSRAGSDKAKPEGKSPGKGAAGLKAAVTSQPQQAVQAGSAQMSAGQIRLAIQVADTVDQVRELDSQIAGVPDDDEREELLTLQDSRIINLT